MEEAVEEPALWAAAILFGVTYLAIVSERIPKTAVALVGGAAMILFGIISQESAFESIDFNVIFLLVGMMVIANITGKTGLFEWMAIRSAKIARGNAVAILLVLCFITAVASAFLDNVTTVVLLAPLTIYLAGTLKLNPVPFLVAEIMASNIGGTATLVGDPPNILIGSRAQLDFLSFLTNSAPVILVIFVIFLGTIWLIFRKDLVTTMEARQRVMGIDEAGLIKDRRLLAISLGVLGLVLLGFLLHSVIHLEVATIALMGAGLLLVLGRQDPHDALRDVEWTTIFFFVGLFMVVAGLDATGALRDIGNVLADVSGGSLGAATMFVLWPSAFLSSVVNQIPYSAAMLPVVEQISAEIDAPGGTSNPLWWALVLGVGLGANLTVVGAAANVFVVNVARRAGHSISFFAFLKYGLPVTLLSVAAATVYLWLRYLVF